MNRSGVRDKKEGGWEMGRCSGAVTYAGVADGPRWM